MAKQCERNKARINVNLVALKLNSEARSTGRQSEQRAQLSFQYLAIYSNEKLSNIKTMGSKIVQYQNYGLKIQIKTSKTLSSGCLRVVFYFGRNHTFYF